MRFIFICRVRILILKCSRKRVLARRDVSNSLLVTNACVTMDSREIRTRIALQSINARASLVTKTRRLARLSLESRLVSARTDSFPLEINALRTLAPLTTVNRACGCSPKSNVEVVVETRLLVFLIRRQAQLNASVPRIIYSTKTRTAFMTTCASVK